jgi:hypothetical protein
MIGSKQRPLKRGLVHGILHGVGQIPICPASLSLVLVPAHFEVQFEYLVLRFEVIKLHLKHRHIKLALRRFSCRCGLVGVQLRDAFAESREQGLPLG